MNSPKIRILDFILALAGLIVTSPALVIVMIIGRFESGSPIFRQERVGRSRRSFTLFKFRTMPIDTRSVGTHEIDGATLRPFGQFLRRSKLDELPQLVNVLRGEMSLVGPRPCLTNQLELIEARSARNVFDVLPGITGLAQLNNIDMSTPELLAEWDQRMINNFTFLDYARYILMTATGQGAGDRVA